MELSGKLILVTGASGGLGREIASQIEARGGYALRTSGGECDISVAEDRSVITQLVVDHGGIDGVVFASGVVGFGAHGGIPQGSVQRLIDVNTVGPLELTNDLLPHLRDGGSIVFITGAVVDFTTAGMAAYTAAKAGLSAACPVLRRELRSRKINVIDARPPHTETGLATRAVYGEAPKMKQGLEPDVVAKRIVDAMVNDENELAPVVFGE
ncbi:MAG: SDR family NAD(P)-dependent oxidoreductase [Ilumatobacteraceae bacterium]|nr:SDR family NAD(P)-dependent oxidoreductase [Ilumatobacteraceae bacterium]